MSDVDITMRALLTCHRIEVNDLEQKLANSQSIINSQAYDLDRERRRATSSEQKLTEARTTLTEKSKRIDKLTNIIETLKLELATEREENTRLKDVDSEGNVRS